MALTFESDNINDIKFNVSGTDDLIWDAKYSKMFCCSHGRGKYGRGDRDVFTIEWKTEKGCFAPGMEIREIPDASSDFQGWDQGPWLLLQFSLLQL